MTAFLDTTAVMSLFIAGPNRSLVEDLVRGEPAVCASHLALTESEMLIERLDLPPTDMRRLRQAFLRYWDSLHVVPVDARCLTRAGEIGRHQPVRIADAIHLAAADRVPRPVRFATFDPNQIGPALDLGFDVVSAIASGP